MIATAILLIASASTSFAQSTATATATAIIVSPISLTKNVDMNFGNVAVQTAAGGTVVLATDGSRTKTGGVTLPNVAGSPAAASFTVDGQGAYTYAITLPSSALTITSGLNSSNSYQRAVPLPVGSPFGWLICSASQAVAQWRRSRQPRALEGRVPRGGLS